MSPKRRHLRRGRAPVPPEAPAPANAASPAAREGDLVLLAHAEDMAEAQRYRRWLQGYGIPVAIEAETRGATVLPEKGCRSSLPKRSPTRPLS